MFAGDITQTNGNKNGLVSRQRDKVFNDIDNFEEGLKKNKGKLYFQYFPAINYKGKFEDKSDKN